MNIPVYRGFSETFNKYILGVPYFSDGRYYMLVDDCNKNNDIGSGSFPIDPTTLSINFHDMLDSQGNKIFASLNEDGKGGDIFILGDERLKYIAMITQNQLMAKQQGTYGSLIGQGYAETNKWKIIGIQE